MMNYANKLLSNADVCFPISKSNFIKGKH
jgi:hypothetical protein